METIFAPGQPICGLCFLEKLSNIQLTLFSVLRILRRKRIPHRAAACETFSLEIMVTCEVEFLSLPIN